MNTELYPSYDIKSCYKQKASHHFINTDFIELQMIHINPDIFLVHNLLTPDECKLLIDKHQVKHWPSRLKGDATNRRSLETRIPNNETTHLQHKFSQLLNIPTSHMEPLKVTKYDENNFFHLHGDGITVSPDRIRTYSPHLYSNRVITTLVYLNDNHTGGETIFPQLINEKTGDALKVKPTKAMGLIFFPAYLPTFETNPGAKDPQTVHAAMLTEEMKYVCQQWCWSYPYHPELDRSYDIVQSIKNGRLTDDII